MSARLSKRDAEKKLRFCLEHGTVEQHPHFKKALHDDGLDYVSALPVLKSGHVHDEPEFDTRFQQWRYKIEGREVDGKWLAIVFCFPDETDTLLITAFVIMNR